MKEKCLFKTLSEYRERRCRCHVIRSNDIESLYLPSAIKNNHETSQNLLRKAAEDNALSRAPLGRHDRSLLFSAL